jgi:myosin heavy subunit
MAEKPIQGNEIVATGVFDETIKAADLLIAKLHDMEQGFKDNLAVTKQFIETSKVDNSKNLKDNAQATKDATANLLALEKVQQETIKAEKLRLQVLQEAEKVERERIKTSQQASKAEQQYNKEIEKTTKAQKATNSEYAQASQALNTLSKRLKDNAIAGRETSKTGKLLAQEFANLKDKIDKADHSAQDFRRNVGNYPKELKLIQRELQGLEPGTKQFNELAKKAGELKDKISDAKDATKAFATESKATTAKTLFGQVLDDVKNLDFKGAAEKAATFASVVKTISFSEAVGGIKSFGSALLDIGKALLTNPFTLIIAGIAALVYVTYDLTTAFRKFNEQAQATNEYLRETNERIKKLAELQLDFLLKYKVALGQLTQVQADAVRLDKKYSNDRLAASKEFAKKSVELANELGINLDKSERGRFIDAARKQGYAQIKEKARREAYNRELLKLENKFKEEILAITKTKLAEEASVNAEAEAARKKDLEDKAKQRAKDFRDNTKSLNEELKRLQIEDTFNSEQQETQKVIFENEKEVERIKNTVANAETKNRFLIELEFKLQNDLRAIREKFANERQAQEKKEAEDKIAAEKKVDEQILKSGSDSAKVAQENLDKANAQEKKKSDDRKKQREEDLKDTIDFGNKVLDAIAANVAKESEIKQQAINKDIENTNKNIETQKQLAAAGKQNTLAEEEAAKVKKELALREEKEAEIKRQKALLFIKSVMSFIDKGDEPAVAFGKAAASMALVEVASAAFIEGTENVGKDKQFAKNKFSNGTDGYVARFDGDERILNPEQNKKIGNLSNEALADLAYQSRMGLLDTAKYAVVQSTDFATKINDSALLQQNALLIKELKEVKQAINDKPVPNFAMNQYHEFVLTTIENGFIKNRIFKNRKSRIC